MKQQVTLFTMLLLLLLPLMAESGPLSYGICQSGCNALVVSCYAAAGFTFGTVTAGAAGFAPTP